MNLSKALFKMFESLRTKASTSINLKTSRLLVMLLLLTFIKTPALLPQSSGITATTTPSSSRSSRLFTPQLKKSIVKIEADCIGDNPGTFHFGTGFFVGMPSQLDEKKVFVYLVTNRHVAQPGIEKGSACKVGQYRLKVNLRSADTNGSFISTATFAALNWTFPVDPSTDLAVVPLNPDSAVDYKYISIADFLTRSMISQSTVVEGQRLLFAGIFAQFVGLKKLEPIIREGTLAMIPDEKLPTTLNQSGDLYLAEVHAFQGNSGSPVFVDTDENEPESIHPAAREKLLGVVSGYEFEDTKLMLNPAPSGEEQSVPLRLNSNLSLVVPADLLLDLLNSPKLLQERADGQK